MAFPWSECNCYIDIRTRLLLVLLLLLLRNHNSGVLATGDVPSLQANHVGSVPGNGKQPPLKDTLHPVSSGNTLTAGAAANVALDLTQLAGTRSVSNVVVTFPSSLSQSGLTLLPRSAGASYSPAWQVGQQQPYHILAESASLLDAFSMGMGMGMGMGTVQRANQVRLSTAFLCGWGHQVEFCVQLQWGHQLGIFSNTNTRWEHYCWEWCEYICA